jgi:hypothetical protein
MLYSPRCTYRYFSRAIAHRLGRESTLNNAKLDLLQVESRKERVRESETGVLGGGKPVVKMTKSQ